MYGLKKILAAALAWGFFCGPSSGSDFDIRLNSVGYPPDTPKIATILNAVEGAAWTLKPMAGGKAVLAGVLSRPFYDKDTETLVSFADFSEAKLPGAYELVVEGVGKSSPFLIREDIYKDSLILQMKGFYGQRCGMEVTFHHQGRTYGHRACHTQDAFLEFLGGSYTASRDANGGWHDAGDHNKYVTPAGLALGQLMLAWEHFPGALSKLQLPHLKGGQAGLPDYLAEIKWELDWLMKMPYGPGDGRVSEKISAIAFSPFRVPELDWERRYFCPYSSAATAAFAAVMARAARVYQPYDPDFARDCLEAARLSWRWLALNPGEVPPDQSGFRTGSYAAPDGPLRLAAASELWDTTGEAEFLAFVEMNFSLHGTHLDWDWDWGNQRNLALYTYALSKREGRNKKLVARLRKSILEATGTLLEMRAKSGYGRAYGRYCWGANGGVARTAPSLYTAYRLTGRREFLDAAADQLSHLYGRNFYNRSQVTGEGLNPPRQPHHRASAAHPERPPWPGLLVGGGHTPTGWLDQWSSAETNEVAIVWSAAMAYNLAMFLPQP